MLRWNPFSFSVCSFSNSPFSKPFWISVQAVEMKPLVQSLTLWEKDTTFSSFFSLEMQVAEYLLFCKGKLMPSNSEYRYAMTNFVLFKKMLRCSSQHVSNSLMMGGGESMGTLPTNWPVNSCQPCIAACSSVNVHVPIFPVLTAADNS